MKRSLRSWLWRVPLDEEVSEELELHAELRTRELIARGVDPARARQMATARIGDVARLTRTCVDLGRKRDREMRLIQWLDELRHDVTFAIRQMKGAPQFTLVAAITLALGIGVNSAIFALADATLLRPLPYAEPERLVMLWEQTPAAPRDAVSPANLRDWSEQNSTFVSMAAIELGAGGGPVLTGPDGTMESAERQTVTTHFFEVLGVKPIAGRTFQAADEGPTTTVVVLTEGLWRRRFGGDPTLVGRDVRLNGRPYTVIGVVPDEVQFRRPNQIWTLMADLPPTMNQRSVHFLEVVGRLKAGVTLEAANADLTVVSHALARAFPDTNKDRGVTVHPLRNGLIGRELQLTSILLLGIVALVLLMCCANVANLVMARASVRARELAVRSALGAGRSRIIRQLVTESLVLALFGGALGIAAGAAILEMAPALIPAGLLSAAVKLTFDGRVVLFGAAAALGVGVLFGVVPAWQATRTSLVQAIASDSRSTTRGGGRFRSLLVAGQIAAAVLLLCGAGLLLRTLLVLGSFDQGYRAERDSVLTLDFSLPGPAPGSRYPTVDAFLEFYDAVQQEVLAVPGVRSVGWSTFVPPTTSELGRRPFAIAGEAEVAMESRPTTEYAASSPGYFNTLDLPIVAGRRFTDRDTRESPPICIVNEAFVRRYLQGRDPIGARVALWQSRRDTAPPSVREVVGVARQVKGRPDEPEELVQLYVPLTQNAVGDVFLVVQAAAGRPETFVPAIRALVARRDVNLSVRRIRTLEILLDEATAGYQFRAVMVAIFAALALVLAMVGVFGVLAYSVQQRSREFGLRMVLGASMSDVLRLVVGNAARVIAAGAATGLLLAAALSQTISAFLFRVQPLDPLTFVSVAVVLVITATVATLAPALRAARVDPVTAIRE